MKKRIFSLCIVMFLLVTGITGTAGTASAASSIEVKLENLEQQKEKNLISIKKQLTQQDMMEHYCFYEEIIEQEYNALKSEIQNKYGIQSLNGKVITLNYGGHVSYVLGEKVSPDPRAHAYMHDNYFNRAETEAIIKEYDRNNRACMQDTIEIIIGLAAQLGKVPFIGDLLTGIGAAKLLRDIITADQITAVENSGGCMTIGSCTTVVGTSTVYRVWDNAPYVNIPDAATQVNIQPFMQ